MGSGVAVYEYGTQKTVISDTAIASDAFSGAPITALVLAVDELAQAPLGDAVLDVQMATAAIAGEAFHLYRRDLNIDGTNDAPVPVATYKHTYLGSFSLALVSTREYYHLTGIPLSQDQEFYLHNDSARATTGTTVLKVTPKSYNVKA